MGNEREIWKYDVRVDSGSTLIQMPKGGKILHVGAQHPQLMHQVQFWVEVDPQAELEERNFVIVGTGMPFNDENVEYLGTVIVAAGSLVWHLYEWTI